MGHQDAFYVDGILCDPYEVWENGRVYIRFMFDVIEDIEPGRVGSVMPCSREVDESMWLTLGEVSFK